MFCDTILSNNEPYGEEAVSSFSLKSKEIGKRISLGQGLTK